MHMDTTHKRQPIDNCPFSLMYSLFIVLWITFHTYVTHTAQPLLFEPALLSPTCHWRQFKSHSSLSIVVLIRQIITIHLLIQPITHTHRALTRFSDNDVFKYFLGTLIFVWCFCVSHDDLFVLVLWQPASAPRGFLAQTDKGRCNKRRGRGKGGWLRLLVA